MKIYHEESLRNFEFWGGAKDTAEALTNEQLDQIEAILEEVHPDGLDAGELNDIFHFEVDWIAELLGFSSWENLEAGIDRETEAEIDRIKEEIDDLEEQLYDLGTEYNDLSADLPDDEARELWETEYAEQDKDLREEIDDLYKELEDLVPET